MVAIRAARTIAGCVAPEPRRNGATLALAIELTQHGVQLQFAAGWREAIPVPGPVERLRLKA